MDGFESMLSRMVNGSVVIEGGYAVGGSIDPDPQFAAAIEESTLPTSVLIQTLEADTHSGILMALEEFELAQIIGSAELITEGSGAAGASVVMEGILRKFWDALVEKIKAIGRWLKGIWDKIFKKSDEKAETPAIKEAIDHVEGRSPEAKKLGGLNKQLDKVRADAKKGVEAAVNICGDNFVFINYLGVIRRMGIMENKMGVLTADMADTVQEIIDKAFKNRDETNKSGGNIKASDMNNADKGLNKGLNKDSKAVYQSLSQELVGKSCDTMEQILKVIDDEAGLNNTSNIKKSESLPTANEFDPIFKAVESGHLKTEVNTTVSMVNRALSALVKVCEDAQKQCDSGNAYDTKVNSVLTKQISILNTTISVCTQAMNRVWSIVYNASGRYAGIVNRVMKYGKKEAAAESTDWQMYMESGDVKEDVPEDDDATGDGKATTEGYFGGYAGGGGSSLSAYLNGFV